MKIRQKLLIIYLPYSVFYTGTGFIFFPILILFYGTCIAQRRLKPNGVPYLLLSRTPPPQTSPYTLPVKELKGNLKTGLHSQTKVTY